MSSWNALVTEVNTAITDINEAASEANAAATQAREAVTQAATAVAAAEAATEAATEAAEAANAETDEWANATFSVTKLGEDQEPTFDVTDRGSYKHFAIGVPVGKTGADGAKGETGESGMTYTLTGTTLYINKVGG